MCSFYQKGASQIDMYWLAMLMLKIYTIEEDEEGYQYVKRYRISWKYWSDGVSLTKMLKIWLLPAGREDFFPYLLPFLQENKNRSRTWTRWSSFDNSSVQDKNHAVWPSFQALRKINRLKPIRKHRCHLKIFFGLHYKKMVFLKKKGAALNWKLWEK